MTLTVHLPSLLGEYVASQVASGCYADAEDLVRDAVRHHALGRQGWNIPDEENIELAEALLAGVRSPKQALTEEVWTSIHERAAQVNAGA